LLGPAQIQGRPLAYPSQEFVVVHDFMLTPRNGVEVWGWLQKSLAVGCGSWRYLGLVV
jgi:hypothetical protein